MKPRVGGNGHSVDKLNEDYLQTRNATGLNPKRGT
jgi:hypothetical protein